MPKIDIAPEIDIETGNTLPLIHPMDLNPVGKKWIERQLKFFVVGADFISLSLSFILSKIIQNHWLSASSLNYNLTAFYLLSTFIFLFSAIRFWQNGHYVLKKSMWNALRDIIHITGTLVMVTSMVLMFTRPFFPFTIFITTWLLTIIFIPIFRLSIKWLFVKFDIRLTPTVVLGSGKKAIGVINAINSDPLMGLHIFAFLEINRENIPECGHYLINGNQIPVLELSTQPVRLLEELGHPHVVVALEPGGISAFSRLLETLNRHVEHMEIVPTMSGLPLLGLQTNSFYKHGVLLLGIRNSLSRPVAKCIKRTFDIIFASFLLLLFSPLFICLAYIIRRDGGTAIFGHPRIGHAGKPFCCYKFRTMVPHAQMVLQRLLDSDPEKKAEWEKYYKLKKDPRITPIGRFLRKSSLDELPQLLNVLKGEMSLVGPRPIVREEMKKYKDKIYYYLNTKPGMTGIWQISGRNKIDYENRVYLDTWYVKNWSIFYDLSIIIKTIGVVLKKSGAY